MNRVIKFRAWDKNIRRMSVVFDLAELATPGAMSADYFNHSANWVVMQFTGLKDKNGKEIYEGDIVQGVVALPQLLTSDTDENSDFKMAGEVFYDHHGFELRVIQSMCDPNREGMVNYFSFISDDGAVFEDIEIIGNIYEDEDLLTNQGSRAKI